MQYASLPFSPLKCSVVPPQKSHLKARIMLSIKIVSNLTATSFNHYKRKTVIKTNLRNLSLFESSIIKYWMWPALILSCGEERCMTSQAAQTHVAREGCNVIYITGGPDVICDVSPNEYSYFEKGCRKRCTRQSRKALWMVFSSLFFKEIWKNGKERPWTYVCMC